MTERTIPEVDHVFYRVRVMDEAAGTFRDLWQHVAGGSQVGYVDDKLVPVQLPKKHSALPLSDAPHFLPGVETDPDPEDTAKRRETAARLADAANAVDAARAETIIAGGSQSG